MTLLETERLVRKLASVMAKPLDPPLALKLAEDYAALCEAANFRLLQCDAMIRSGDIPQALQLAETQPNLLELITLLEFGQSDAWRAYCQVNHLPVVDEIDRRAVQRLNQAYAQGVSTNDLFYKKYRKAILTKKEKEASLVLRTIVRLSPSDANARSELARLDAKLLGDEIARLRAAVEQGNSAEVARLSRAIEEAGYQTPPRGEDWRRAQAIRATELLREAEQYRHAHEWRLCLTHLDLIEHLQIECQFELSAEDHARFHDLKEWGSLKLEQHLTNESFKEHIKELALLLNANEEKDTVARAVPFQEIKSDFESLHKQWRAVEGFGKAVPEELAGRFKKRVSLLQAEIARRTRLHLKAAVLATVAVLLLGGILARLGLTHFNARDFARELKSAENSRQMRTVERLVSHLRQKETRLLSVGALQTALAHSESYLARERALLKSYQSRVSTLPESIALDLPLPEMLEIQNQAERVARVFTELPPQIQSEEQHRIMVFRNKWEEALAARMASVNSLFESNLLQLEKTAPLLNLEAGYPEARRIMASLTPLVESLQGLTIGYSNLFSIRPDLLSRQELVQARITPIFRELSNIDAARAAMDKANSFKDYAAAIELLCESKFNSLPEVQAARKLAPEHLDEETLLQALLCPGNLGLSTYLRTHSNDWFMPKVFMPAELKLIREAQEAAQAGSKLNRYYLVSTDKTARTVEWLTLGELDRSVGWKTIQAYDSAASPNVFVLKQVDYGLFDGRYRLTPTDVLDYIQDLGPCRETSGSWVASLDGLVLGETCRKPILQFLDELVQSSEGSPLFRAYVFLKLAAVMELQPEVWGLAFCPELADHHNKLRKMAGSIGVGDWFSPSRVNRLQKPLEEFFQAARAVSYFKEAKALATVTRQAWAAGLQFAGYADLKGCARFDHLAREAWGFKAGENSPSLLKAASSKGELPSHSATPLSPIFHPKRPLLDILAGSGLKSNSPSFHNALPPLFQPVRVGSL